MASLNDPSAGSDLLTAARAVVALTFDEARSAERAGRPLLYCLVDVLNPCFDGRIAGFSGQHWGGGPACAECMLRAAVTKATGAAS